MAVGFEETPYEIPKSRGIPPIVRYLSLAALVVIFFMGFVSVFYAGTFHVWPAPDTVKVQLPGRF